MPITEGRYQHSDTSPRRFGRPDEPAPSGQGKAPQFAPPMDARKAHVADLHHKITQAQYLVDPEAVADAILRRLLEGRSLKP